MQWYKNKRRKFLFVHFPLVTANGGFCLCRRLFRHRECRNKHDSPVVKGADVCNFEGSIMTRVRARVCVHVSTCVAFRTIEKVEGVGESTLSLTPVLFLSPFFPFYVSLF